MTKIKSLLLAVIGLLCATGVSAHDFEVDGICYNITSSIEKTVAVTNYVEDSNFPTSVYIPEIVSYNQNLYHVTSIGDNAFYNCYGLTSVEIPNSVTSIGDYAFSDCEELSDVTISNGGTSMLTSIGDYAFSGCFNLFHAPIVGGVTSIGDYAFLACFNLTSVYIPSSVISIGNCAFWGCDLTSLYVDMDNPVYDSRWGCNAIIESISNTLIIGCQSTKIPNSVTSIGNNAFRGCGGLTSIEIPNSVTSIGNGAFYGCDLTSLVVAVDNPVYDSRGGCNAIIESTSNTLIAGCKTTIIPNDVCTIGCRAFYGCGGMTFIDIPNSVTCIGNSAFEECWNLTSVDIPNSVTCIGNSAFKECSNLTSVDIPNSVAKIGKRAFWNCFDLTSVVIPNSVTNIECDAFAGCSNLINITVADDNQIYDSREHCNAIIECETNTLIIGCKTSTIPNSVVHIGKWAFAGCSRLSSVNIPNSVTSIGDYAFGYCYDLTSVVIPNSVTNIGDYAFSHCFNLRSFISDVPAEILFPISDNVFDEEHKTICTLYVPHGAKETYASTPGWQNFMNIVEMSEDGTTDIDKVQTELGRGNAIYDLYGRKLNHVSRSGFYILNGKKVWVK
ncbi:MAG: leucine-rich repeat domain-containing protein [Bacteroidaceae bacterium]|nr:leucine-rich repeat domain-containing protein [Bacteroidaceae bacterium]